MSLDLRKVPLFNYRYVIILLFLSLGVWLTTCGLTDLRGADEARYVQIAKELQGRGNWFLLTVNGEAYDQKPPLFFWLLALMLKLTGGEVISWFLRLPSVLASVGSVLLVYSIGRRCFSEKVGFFSALVFLSSPLVLDNASEAKLDMAYTFWVTLSLLPWVTRKPGEGLSLGNSVLMWSALAGAFFTKGPLAVLIVLSVILFDALRTRSFFAVLKQSRVWIGLPVLILLIYGWLQIQRAAVGDEFVHNQVQGETVDRLLRGAHGAPFWYYIPRTFSGMFPWAFLLIPIFGGMWKGRKEVPARVWALLGWFLPTFILLCVAHGKRQSYMLPIFPPLALLVGWKLDLWFKTKTTPLPGSSKVLGALWDACGAIFIASIAFLLAKPEMIEAGGFSIPVLHLLIGLVLSVAIICVSVVCLRRARTGETLFYSTVGGVLLVFTLNFVIVQPALDVQKSARPLPLFLEARCGTILRVNGLAAIRDASNPEYHVYGDYAVTSVDVKVLKTEDKLPEFLLVRKEAVGEYPFLSVAPRYSHDGSITVSGDDLSLYKRIADNTPKKIGDK